MAKREPQGIVRSRVAPAPQHEPEFFKKPDKTLIRLPRMDPVCTAVFERVIKIERRINAAEDNGNVARGFPHEPDCLLRPGIPVRHDRGHEYDIERHEGLKPGPEVLDGHAIAFIISWYRAEQVRFLDYLALIFADAVRVRLERISAVDKKNIIVKSGQILRDFQQAERPRPEVKGREVMDPGINEQDAGFHDKQPVIIIITAVDTDSHG